MKLVFAAILIVVIAFVGSRLSFVHIRLPLGVRNLFLTGIEYLLVGFLLGGAVLDLLDATTLDGLYPFMGMGLSWIGMLFGVQWEFRRLSHIPGRVFGVALVQSLITLVVVAVPFLLLFQNLYARETELLVIGAVTLAAAASGTASSGLTLFARNTPAPARPLMRLLTNVSNIDDLVGLTAFGLISCLAVLHAGGSTYTWIGVSAGLGLTVGLLVVALTANRLKDDEMLLIVMGAITFSGGLSLYLSLSPLLVNLIAGVIVANLARGRARAGIRTVLLRGEHSIYIIFLILVGAGWRIESVWLLALVPVYVLVRTLGKTLGGFVSVRLFLPGSRALSGLGLGLLSHGGMAVAIVVNLHQIHRSEVTDAVISVVLLGIIASELIAPSSTRRLLGKTP
ncbi:MAG: hypothetical protein OXH06_13025 [Gemmatimonadetes bacterium]|nr:hypothetical protein [Gemmatimonadota bacterium]